MIHTNESDCENAKCNHFMLDQSKDNEDKLAVIYKWQYLNHLYVFGCFHFKAPTYTSVVLLLILVKGSCMFLQKLLLYYWFNIVYFHIAFRHRAIRLS